MTFNLPSAESIAELHDAVWRYYDKNGRSMPWRTDHQPYFVLVSELMLQQTQVARVIPKFEQFIALFADVLTLAQASLSDVLVAWQGLGYNRRARFLHEAAKMIVADYGGHFPDTLEGLMNLPGVGKNTAGAIMAYAYDTPVVFIETNIRTVLFHHFFNNMTEVDDKELVEVMKACLPTESIREWYWALMDYGSFLKQTAGGRLDQSRHYKKQAPLKGSVREVRGQIIRILGQGSIAEAQIRELLRADERYEPAIEGLIRDGLVTRSGDKLGLTV